MAGESKLREYRGATVFMDGTPIGTATGIELSKKADRTGIVVMSSGHANGDFTQAEITDTFLVKVSGTNSIYRRWVKPLLIWLRMVKPDTLDRVTKNMRKNGHFGISTNGPRIKGDRT